MCEHPKRCEPCSSLRRTLRKAACRQQNASENSTLVDSHTTYFNLTPSEKDARLRNMHHSLIVAKQKNVKLEARISKLIDDNAVHLDEHDATDIISLMSEVSPAVKANFPPDSPQRIFWDQQVLYNSVKDKRQMRWHPLIIKFALNLKYLSTSAYKAMRKSGIIHLPSERTLSDYTHWSTIQTGVNLDFIEEFDRLLGDVECHQKHCTVSMDEMKIKSGLVYDKHSGMLVGFVDLGKVNHDIEVLMTGAEDGKDVSKQLADQVFVLMARAVFKPTLSLPVAHYFSLNLKGTVS